MVTNLIAELAYGQLAVAFVFWVFGGLWWTRVIFPSKRWGLFFGPVLTSIGCLVAALIGGFISSPPLTVLGVIGAIVSGVNVIPPVRRGLGRLISRTFGAQVRSRPPAPPEQPPTSWKR